MQKNVAIIVALDQSGGFGKQGRNPWPHIKLHRLNFTKQAKDATLIIGRKTWESFLPEDREMLHNNYKITLVTKTLKQIDLPEGVLLTSNVEAGIEAAGTEKICLLGGFGIFKEALSKNFVHTIHRTNLLGNFNCDVFFPKLSKDWEIAFAGSRLIDKASQIPISFDVLKKNTVLQF